MPIQSHDNAKFKAVLELIHSSRERRKRRQTFIEGIHLCAAYLERFGAPVLIVVTETALANPQVAPLLGPRGTPLLQLNAALFRELSQVQHGIGIAYVIATPHSALPERISQTTVYLDQVQDPGNVGTILRTCAAAGVRRLIASPGTAYCWAPKVVRAAMGAHFLIDIHEGVNWPQLQPCIAVPTMSTVMGAKLSLWQADLRAPCLWLFGNEGAGLSPAIQAQVQNQLMVPIDPTVESLNVAAAVAICLFEQRRQQLR
jgi:RNA methyltransferase, TrmH family